jgi:2-keto-4-pentenoate hydratase/2-oxohepta-3-ene-1,7-dioic acid hydratase in catechol pathway
VIKRPPKIIAIGLNYRAHAEESNMALPDVPLVFTKQSTSANGPYSPIYWSEEGKAMDYEGELALVIARNCRRVTRHQAKEVILGFCVANDVSVRDWQMRGTPPSFTMGKSWDSHCPIGPAIVVDEDIDPHNLRLQTWVNGTRRQDSRTDDLIFDCYALIEFLSTAFTLEAGDVILTGTPSGVGFAQQPPARLVPGDRVRVEIEGLGAIENEVMVEPEAAARF